ncbi:hypothetical protein CHEID_01830 [Corynebacterium heidelbergense]|uniref:DUF2334 domain-containing protein n=2 Tax=Corynebacterium heidelbergense TaxID=2055947 RepID=A0A364VBF5_9CORY|nr:DUF2334 domain-containing protein [Corynebacterium heidelbergense]WCZ35943.1 hypothetical protein CHEID_01830 [Corynebacterium heidelbergense]
MNVSESPALMFTITGIRQETVVGAERMRNAAAEMGIRAGLVLSVQREKWHLKNDPSALEFIHESVVQGHEQLLGGLGPLATAGGAAEFHKLGQHESTLRITAAQRQLSALGLHADIFAPSRWLASAEARAAAQRRGMGIIADAYTVRNLDRGTQQDVRVLAFGDGFGAAKWWRRNVKNSVRRHSNRRQDVRLSISASKACRKDVAGDLEWILQDLMGSGYTPMSYAHFADRSFQVAA